MIDAHGPADTIRVGDLPMPVPGPDEVLVRVEHGAVNHVDTFVRSGAWRTPMAFPFVVGRDAVGTVVDAGAAAADAFPPGTAVWTNSLGHDGRDGALAEFVRVPRERLYRRRPEISGADMAALCHPAATAWLALFHHGGLQAGQRVLIVGGGGNVGGAAVQLAVRAGAHVLASARPAAHDGLRAVGAVPVLSRRALGTDDLGGEVDLIVDTAGTNDLESYVPALSHGGRIVLLAGMASSVPLPVGRLYLNGGTVTGFTISRTPASDLALAAHRLNDMIATAGLRPGPTTVVPLDQVADAHRRLEAGEVRGKIVVEVAATDREAGRGAGPTTDPRAEGPRSA